MMLRPDCIRIASLSFLLAATSLTGLALADDPVFVDSYPFCSCKAVASQTVGSTSSADLIFSGAGGGVFALEATSDVTPGPWSGSPNDALAAEGFDYDVDLTSKWVLVAAGVGGVRGFDRLSTPPLSETSTIKITPSDLDIRSVDIQDDVLHLGSLED